MMGISISSMGIKRRSVRYKWFWNRQTEVNESMVIPRGQKGGILLDIGGSEHWLAWKIFFYIPPFLGSQQSDF
jgi:hypothetical protein